MCVCGNDWSMTWKIVEFRGEEYFAFSSSKVCCRIDRVIISTKLHELINNANYTSGTIDYGEFICSMCDSDSNAIIHTQGGCIDIFPCENKIFFFFCKNLEKNMR